MFREGEFGRMWEFSEQVGEKGKLGFPFPFYATTARLPLSRVELDKLDLIQFATRCLFITPNLRWAYYHLMVLKPIMSRELSSFNIRVVSIVRSIPK